MNTKTNQRGRQSKVMNRKRYDENPMIQEVVRNVFKIMIPLPAALLGSVNVYLVKGPDRNLLIDTGLHAEKCKKVMFDSLDKLGVNLRNTDFFITHHHADHFGLFSDLVSDESVVYIHRSDVLAIEKIGTHAALDELKNFLIIADFPEHEPRKLMPSDVGNNYRMPHSCSLRLITGGDELVIGDFRLLCLHTPGHTNGHMCLYEPEKKFLVSGDHLLGDITPSIQLRNDIENPLQDYLNTFETLAPLAVDLVLPGHRSIFTNYKERIEQLKAHHKNRENEVIAVLARNDKTAYEVASQITWSITECDGWDTVPALQKLFATGEAMAHLKYLQEKGKIQKYMKGPAMIYSLASA
jgi:glyoxylase-like metal-dependent hydrolase (beta-lactamase superfamily II)